MTDATTIRIPQTLRAPRWMLPDHQVEAGHDAVYCKAPRSFICRCGAYSGYVHGPQEEVEAVHGPVHLLDGDVDWLIDRYDLYGAHLDHDDVERIIRNVAVPVVGRTVKVVHLAHLSKYLDEVLIDGRTRRSHYLEAHHQKTKQALYPSTERAVYLIQSFGLVKIGVTGRFWRKRVRDIQNMSAAPVRVRLVLAADEAFEQYLHRIFAAWRRHGEWFALPNGWNSTVKEIAAAHAVDVLFDGDEHMNPSVARSRASDVPPMSVVYE